MNFDVLLTITRVLARPAQPSSQDCGGCFDECAPSARNPPTGGRNQISQRQRIACWRGEGRNENRVASETNRGRESPSSTKKADAIFSAKRTRHRPVEFCLSGGVAGHSFLTEQQQTRAAPPEEQHARVTSSARVSVPLPDVRRHDCDPHRLPFPSQAPVAKSTPEKETAAISDNETKGLDKNWNITTPSLF